MKHVKTFGAVLMLLMLAHQQIKSQDVVIDVDPSTMINDHMIGFGWNVGPFNTPGVKSQVEKYMNYLVNSGQSWIRLILYNWEWEQENDDNDPWTLPSNFSGFLWDDGSLDPKLEYLLDVCEENDIWVEVNNWSTLKKTWINHELDANGHVTKAEAELKAEEFGENLAALLYYLKYQANGGLGYDCVKYYAVWNEPNGGYEGHDFITFDYPGYHNMLYNQVKAHLEYYDTHEGTKLMEELSSFGMEAHPTWRNSEYAGGGGHWYEMTGEGVLEYLEEPNGMPGEITDWPGGDASMDYLSTHTYTTVFDYDIYNPSIHNQATLKGHLLPNLVGATRNQIAAHNPDGKIEPLLINEIGSKSYGVEGDEPAYDHGLFMVEALTRAVNAGISGGSTWAFNQHSFYAAISYPGCWWGASEPVDEVHPVAENYYPYSLLARTIRRGDQVITTTVTGGADNSKGEQTYFVPVTQRVFATAVSNEKGIKILAINDSYEPKSITINCPGMGEKGARSTVSSAQYGWIRSTEVTPAGETINDNLEARSITVYNFADSVPVTVQPAVLDPVHRLQLYPNPVKEVLKVSLSGADNGRATYSVINCSGQVVFSGSFHGGEGSTTMQLDLSELEEGFYIFRVESKRHIWTKRLMKL